MLTDTITAAAILTALLPAVRTAAADGATIDLAGYHGCTFGVHLGAPGDTLSGSVYFDFTIQHSDDGSAWSDITDNEYVIGATVAAGGIWRTVDADAEASQVYTIGYRGPKRYVRIQLEKTGTHSNGTPIGAVAYLGPKRAAV